MNNIFSFLSDQVLGMKWLNDLVGNILVFFGLNIEEKLGGAIQFFIYDTIKIIFLLCFLIFIISYIQSFFPPERSKELLSRFKGIKGNIMGALLGTITPFCSCSSIPIFIGFTSSGMPIGVTISFLISSPFVDLASFFLLLSIFGLPVALTYMLVGITLAVVGGVIIEKLGMEKYIEKFSSSKNVSCCAKKEIETKDRVKDAWSSTVGTLRKVIIYILIGVGIGALIHNVIPEEIITNIIGDNNPLAPILAAIISIPIYADIFGTIPIAEALYLKNVPIGTILTFIMGITALSVPSLIMLSKVMKSKLLITFIGIVAVGIILIGYLFNALNFILV